MAIPAIQTKICKKNLHAYPKTERSCAECHRAYRKEWKAKNKDRIKAWPSNNKEYKSKTMRVYYKEESRQRHLIRKYGLTVDRYNQMFIKQEGKCVVCKRHQSEFKTSLAVDHCHKTNKIRGLLCQPCNVSIGLFRDDPEILLNAAAYLEDHK